MDSDLNILDPVPQTPPVTRDMPLRESKWDKVIDKAEKAKDRKNPTIPIAFDKNSSAVSARRRIKDRADKLGKGDNVEAEQRGEKVYVTWID